jgi:hypothetical protein
MLKQHQKALIWGMSLPSRSCYVAFHRKSASCEVKAKNIVPTTMSSRDVGEPVVRPTTVTQGRRSPSVLLCGG